MMNSKILNINLKHKYNKKILSIFFFILYFKLLSINLKLLSIKLKLLSINLKLLSINLKI